jgi:hypothetical protein
MGASSTGGRSTARPGSASRKQPNHLPEGEQDADEQRRDDQAVKARIGHERKDDLLVENHQDERAQDQEHQHPDEKNPGRGQLQGIEFGRHGTLCQACFFHAHYDIGVAKEKRRPRAITGCFPGTTCFAGS